MSMEKIEGVLKKVGNDVDDTRLLLNAAIEILLPKVSMSQDEFYTEMFRRYAEKTGIDFRSNTTTGSIVITFYNRDGSKSHMKAEISSEETKTKA